MAGMHAQANTSHVSAGVPPLLSLNQYLHDNINDDLKTKRAVINHLFSCSDEELLTTKGESSLNRHNRGLTTIQRRNVQSLTLCFLVVMRPLRLRKCYGDKRVELFGCGRG